VSKKAFGIQRERVYCLHLGGEVVAVGEGDHGGVFVAVADERLVVLLVGGLALLQVVLQSVLALGALGVGVRGGVCDA